MRFERIDESVNARRYYEVTLQKDLFDQGSVQIRWGRIGKPGRTRVIFGGKISEVMACYGRMTRKRLMRGYSAIGEERTMAP